MTDEYQNLPKVVHRIDEFKVVINRGSDDGIKVGQNYLIFRLGDNLKDPDSGEDLGILEVVLGRARVTHLQARIATLESSGTVVTRGKKRIIKRGGPFSFSVGGTTEEIEEAAQSDLAEIDTKPGDLAKPI